MTKHAEDLAELGWQYIKCPACGLEGAKAFPKPEQEPEWYHGVDEHGCNRFYHKTEVRPSEFKTPLYTTPPQRTWVGLTDEEIDQITEQLDETTIGWSTHEFAQAVEAKLKEKNT